jgi:prepilin-type N-terminal cleavage/methylation domain-containing protein
MNRKKSGFTLIEILVAFALLCIAVVLLLPLFARSGQNLDSARDGYRAQLCAQRLVLWARDAPDTGGPADFMAEEGFAYGYWVNDDISYLSPGAPPTEVRVIENGFTVPVVIAAVWTADGRMAGRAVGTGITDEW